MQRKMGEAPSITATTALKFGVSNMSERLNYSTSILCTSPSDFYLDVEDKVVWLIPDNNFNENIEVHSNVKWNIE